MKHAEIYHFDQQFDGTHMAPHEIREEARQRGWYGLRIDAREFMDTGKLTIRRMSRKAVVTSTNISRQTSGGGVMGYNDEMRNAERPVSELLDEIERLQTKVDGQELYVRDLEAQLDRAAEIINRLRTALERYGHHLCTCSSLDKMDSGTLFHRSDWPCDCGFKDACREALQEGDRES
jgi:hypothetical protein